MNIKFVFDKDDAFEVEESSLVVNYCDSGDFRYTFWDSKFIPVNWYNKAALDLLFISFAVYAADRLNLRDDADDGWTRNFKLYIPVLEQELWMQNKSLMESLLNFLSGDSWILEFRGREETEEEKRVKKRWEKKKDNATPYDKVCMFSGGLDSFIGAIDLLEQKGHDEKILFVSHYGGGKGTTEYQKYLIDKFGGEYNNREDFYRFYASVVHGRENSTRTRSFMFFAHAIALASTLGKEVVLTIPENGLISLNIPSTFSRIGTSSTRTTHPYYMKNLQKLLDNIGLQVKINNPYQFKTKGEMLQQCKNQEFMNANVALTMSCSHPDVGRHRGEKHSMHCGYCLPCIIRQAAVKKAGIADNSRYYDSNCKLGNQANTCLNSYRQGLKKFDEKYAFMTIQQNGPITENIDDYTGLYIRGMKELDDYIKGIR